MADISFTSANIRAITENGAVTRTYTAGGAITVGHAVYIASDGDVEQADANAGTPAEQAIGIAVAGAPLDADGTVNSGDPCEVCVLGPVGGFSGMTAGDVLYLSNTVGRIADAAGSFSRIMGRAESATVLWVQPIPSDAASS